jgi:plastocyanin
MAQGETWNLNVGAESADKARQVQAFLPNEIWIHAGDTVTWTVKTDEIHTITFLKSGQVRLPFNVGCPGFSPSGLSFDGSTCISTPPLATGQTFSVSFPTPGNYKLVCLVHEDMTGVVHVLDPSVMLPHDQAFYDRKGAEEARELLADRDEGQQQHTRRRNTVSVGTGEIVGGGHHSVSVMRFMRPETVIHVGDTVEWTNDDPVTPHTITFGDEPLNPIPPSNNVTMDADGALHATVTSPSDAVHSGFIVSAPQERVGLPQAPLGATRFRVTFTSAGTYPYICVLHDDLGMKGKIIVLPW